MDFEDAESAVALALTHASLGKLPPGLRVATGHDDHVMLFLLRVGDANATTEALMSVIICVACAAAYCGLSFGAPSNGSVVVLAATSVLLPPTIVGGIVYSRGPWRAFWIGCAVGSVPLVVAVYYLASGGVLCCQLTLVAME